MKNNFFYWKARLKISGTVILTAFLTVFLSFILIFPPVFAADSTSAAKPASPSGTMMEKINKLKEEIASRAANIRLEVSRKLQNKAIFGVIENIDGDRITVSQSGQSKTIVTTEYSEVLSTVKNSAKLVKIKFKDLENGEYISALGDIDDKNSLNAKRIIKSTAVASDSARLMWGKVESVSGSIIKLKDHDNQTQTIQTDFKTQYFLGGEESALSDVKANKVVVARIIESKERLYYSGYIYIVPQSQADKPEKKASPSAQISATPSASPKK